MNRVGVSQKYVLRFIREYSRKHNASPTRQEIADAFGWSKSNARYHVNCLIESGKLDACVFGNRTLSPVNSKEIDPLEHLLKRAEYWQSLGCLIVYINNPPTGFKAYWTDPFALAQEVS